MLLMADVTWPACLVCRATADKSSGHLVIAAR